MREHYSRIMFCVWGKTQKLPPGGYFDSRRNEEEIKRKTFVYNPPKWTSLTLIGVNLISTTATASASSIPLPCCRILIGTSLPFDFEFLTGDCSGSPSTWAFRHFVCLAFFALPTRTMRYLGEVYLRKAVVSIVPLTRGERNSDGLGRVFTPSTTSPNIEDQGEYRQKRSADKEIVVGVEYKVPHVSISCQLGSGRTSPSGKWHFLFTNDQICTGSPLTTSLQCQCYSIHNCLVLKIEGRGENQLQGSLEQKLEMKACMTFHNSHRDGSLHTNIQSCISSMLLVPPCGGVCLFKFRD